eukprot:2333052-Pyramimonas_sp.AAC.1
MGCPPPTAEGASRNQIEAMKEDILKDRKTVSRTEMLLLLLPPSSISFGSNSREPCRPSVSVWES